MIMMNQDGKNKSPLMWIDCVVGRKKIYIAMLLLIQMLLGVSSIFYAILMRNIIDAAVVGNQDGFFLWLGILAGLVAFQIMLRAVNRFLEEYISATVENLFKERLVYSLFYGDYEKTTIVHSGEWMSRLTSDTVVVAEGLTQIVPGVMGMSAKMTGALIAILMLYPILGYLLIPSGVLLIFLTYGFRKALKRLHKKVQEADTQLRVFLQENLLSMLVVRTFGKEKQTISEISKKMDVHKKLRMKRNRFSNFCNVGFGSAMNGGYVIGIGVCGYGILKGTITYGTLMAIMQLISQIQSPFANITGYLPKYYAMLASAERLMDVETFEEDRDKQKQKLSSLNPIDLTNGLPKSFLDMQKFYREEFQSIEFRNVSFTYRLLVKGKDTQAVFEHVNFLIQKGECVAFTGKSGCGKSTIMKLMMGLYHRNQGECFLGTRCDHVLLTAAYRRLFAYVPQGNYLMSGSIREIVAFGDAEDMQDENRISRALSMACADSFVKELSFGIDTLLGEHGLGLSEGQMQRIAIARAIFSDNPILMLDESTSALDEETERKLLDNLKGMTEKTVLIVTHRKAALSICDKEICFTGDKIQKRGCGGKGMK